MKQIKQHHQAISTILAFGLIPLSGFATDIYIPSLPSMASHLNVSSAAVQLSVVLFFISSGLSQLFVGPILDSFGRYRASLCALLIFATASFAIALFPEIHLLYAMRIIQGITIAFVLVAKRAFFADVYSGDKLKHYTSLFVIIWSASPILAPFIGGYLQSLFGWQSNFLFLGILAFGFLLLEIAFSGETLKHFHPFKAGPILNVYGQMLRAGDFSLGLTILGCCYALGVLYAMASPFIIERVFHFTSVATGYSSLFSGVAILIGGTIAKASLKVPIDRKIPIALGLMTAFSVLIILTGIFYANIFVMIGLTVGLHMTGGFVFNTLFAYCLSRWTKNAGTAGGLTGGGMYVGSSVIGYSLVNIYGIRSQAVLGVADITAVVLLGVVFLGFDKFRKSNLKQVAAAVQMEAAAASGGAVVPGGAAAPGDAAAPGAAAAATKVASSTIAAILLLGFLAGCSGKAASPAAAAIPELPVIQLKTGDATVYREYPAAVEGVIDVNIRPQVSGILQKYFVEDGAYVTKGQPLFRIDPAPFVAALNNARASLHTAEAAVTDAQLEIDKLTPLVTGKIVTDIQLRTAEAVKESALGNAERARADIETAKINLGYTVITAPVSGYIGRLQRKTGSVVGPADPMPLTDISDVHTVHVWFALGEHDFIRFKSQYAGATLADKIRHLPPVDLIQADDSAFPVKGRIDAVNGHFDESTGAISFRASFENQHGLLRSGNTGKIRMGLNFAGQMIVPQSATQEVQDKVFVFLVGGDQKVVKQEIVVSGKIGTDYLVGSGLKAGDQIVYRGFDHLHEGDVIKPKPVDIAGHSVVAGHPITGDHPVTAGHPIAKN